jgi:ribosome biogenesis GTPase
LLNALFGREVTRTGKISDAHDKGMHTTTFSEMYFLAPSAARLSAVIDTPGIKGFGSIDMQREEVSHYFREIFRIGQNCRFGNCTHTGEPGCAVQEAVIRGEIAISRFESYMSLLGDCDEAKYR